MKKKQNINKALGNAMTRNIHVLYLEANQLHCLFKTCFRSQLIRNLLSSLQLASLVKELAYQCRLSRLLTTVHVSTVLCTFYLKNVIVLESQSELFLKLFLNFDKFEPRSYKIIFTNRKVKTGQEDSFLKKLSFFLRWRVSGIWV